MSGADREITGLDGAAKQTHVSAQSALEQPRYARFDPKWDWVLGLSSLVIVGLAFVFGLKDGESVTVGGQSLPSVCWFRNATGLDCPGCGMTRGFVAVAHGQLANAWGYNPAALLWFGAIAFQVPFRGWRLARYYRARNSGTVPAFSNKPYSQFWTLVTLGGLGTALIVQWIVRLSLRL